VWRFDYTGLKIDLTGRGEAGKLKRCLFPFHVSPDTIDNGYQSQEGFICAKDYPVRHDRSMVSWSDGGDDGV
jgi:hypothetical protein